MVRLRYAAVWLVPLLCVAACATLLGLRDEPQRAFPHRAHVLEGVSCTTCHKQVADGQPDAPVDLPGPASCLTCHQQPHDTRPCGGCHGRQSDRDAATQAKLHLAFSHRDHKAITSGRCTRCHDAVLSVDGPLKPSMPTCLSCHKHQTEWAARSCSPCHVRMQTEGTRPESHVVHGADFMRRHGTEAAAARDLCSSCHTQSDCLVCHGVHVPLLPSNWHFEQVNRPDMHGRGFLARHSIEARTDPALCTTCHGDASYCQRCHQDRGLLTASAHRGGPHPAGWVGTRGSENRHGIEARMNPFSCASCHGGAGEALCVGCHRVGGAGGNPHGVGFSSDKPLHELPCRLCHMEGR